MKRLLTFIFAIGMLATLSVSAQYTGTPFYGDTTIVLPGDHFMPMVFDLGDSNVVFTADISSTHGSGGFNWRSAEQEDIYDLPEDESLDTFGQWFLWNGGNRSIRTAPDVWTGMFTVYFAEAGWYKAKNWNNNKNSRIYLYETDLTPLDTMTLVNGANTGEFPAFASREWKYYGDDSINVASAGKYLLKIEAGADTLGNSDGIGIYTLFTNDHSDTYGDTNMATLSIDTNLVTDDGEVVITTDMAGDLYIISGDRVNNDARDNHKPLVFGEVVAKMVSMQAVTVGDNTIDCSGLDIGMYTAIVRTANHNNSFEVNFEVISADITLVDYNANQVDNEQFSTDSTYEAGDIWIRASGADVAGADTLFELAIVSTDVAPDGYDLTDSVLQIVADDDVDNFFSLVIYEFVDTIIYDTNFQYLHIATYFPTLNTLHRDHSPIKIWMRKNGFGPVVYKQASNDDYVTEVGGWVDLVIDMKMETDNYQAAVHGDTIDHIDISGYSIGDTSYIGSIVLSKYAEPRFEGMADTVPVNNFTLAADSSSAYTGGTLNITASDFIPFNATNKVVELSIADGDTTGSSVTGMVFTAGADTGTATVVATVQDPGAFSKSLNIAVLTDPVNVLEINSDVQFVLVPNPASTELTVVSENNVAAQLNIYTISGQQVFSNNFTSSEMMIDVSKLAKGTYIVTLVNGNKVQTKKLIVK